MPKSTGFCLIGRLCRHGALPDDARRAKIEDDFNTDATNMIEYDTSRLVQTSFFTPEELRSLHETASEYALRDLYECPRVFEDRAIEYAYVSARVEGCAYTKAGAGMLLKFGLTEDRKRFTDAAMHVGLHSAFMHVMNHARKSDVCTEEYVKDIHEKIADMQLKADELGAARRKAVVIKGSEYKPLASPAPLAAELQRLIKSANSIEDPFEQAAYVHCNLAYLKYFADGNKRTARLMQTAVLVRHGIVPLFMSVDEIASYLQTVSSYYETGDRRPYAEFFVRSFRHTVDSLLGRAPEQLKAMAEDERRLQEARKKRRVQG